MKGEGQRAGEARVGSLQGKCRAGAGLKPVSRRVHVEISASSRRDEAGLTSVSAWAHVHLAPIPATTALELPSLARLTETIARTRVRRAYRCAPHGKRICEAHGKRICVLDANALRTLCERIGRPATVQHRVRLIVRPVVAVGSIVAVGRRRWLWRLRWLPPSLSRLCVILRCRARLA